MINITTPRAGFLPARVVHLHASRFCNLACQHCYSESSPHVRGELDASLIISALALLYSEGYEVLSLSGGEPLLYSGFAQVVSGAAKLGYRINLITNGAPIGPKNLDILTDYISLIAVSLDGAPALHKALRKNEHAFLYVERAFEKLSKQGIPYGISYCVSRESLADMPWAVEFARSKGATVVQFHPFAAIGRGYKLADELCLTEADKARVYVIAALLKQDISPAIHVDLIPIEAAKNQRDDYHILSITNAEHEPLSNLINPLVIDDTGRILPLSYGINPQFALGYLQPNLTQLLSYYKQDEWKKLRFVVDSAFSALGKQNENFVDWFHHIVTASYVL